jgi:hypothetical protein
MPEEEGSEIAALYQKSYNSWRVVSMSYLDGALRNMEQ